MKKETCESCRTKQPFGYGFCENCGHQQVFGSQYDQQHEDYESKEVEK